MTYKRTDDQERLVDLIGSDATHIGAYGGARSGKTWEFLECMVYRGLASPLSRHCAFRFRQNAINQAVVNDTFPKLLRTVWPGMYSERAWNKELMFYQLPNGSEIWFSGLDDKERVEKVLGNEYATLFFNECSQIPYASVITARTRLAQKAPIIDRQLVKQSGRSELTLKAFYDLNPPSKRHWTYKLFLRKLNPETNQPLRNEFNYTSMLMNPAGNAENLAPGYLDELDDLPDRARNRFLLGLFADDDQDALWNEQLLEQQRFFQREDNQLPQMVRIVVAVDPSGSQGEDDYRSDEVGIVVMGLGADGKGYLLEDLSGRYGPKDWAKIVSDAFKRWRADKVVAEVNFGGPLVETVIQAENSSIYVHQIHATRGKAVRAEPISVLYERQQIYHVGYFPELEDQLCSYYPNGYMGMKSPDRGDACIWAATELFPGLTQPESSIIWTPPQTQKRERRSSRYDRR